MGTEDEFRAYWDEDAATYDDSPSHYPQRPQEQAAWAATLRRLLPAPPARVLDMGAGTGFLSLLLAGQGYQVTAADFAAGMLAQLKAKAADRGLAVEVAETDATHPPAGEFDAVIERHLIWTLPDPASALAAWHTAAPAGRLVLVEGSWSGRGLSATEQLLRQARALADLVRRPAPDHHASYTPQMNATLPYRGGLSPDEAVALVEASPWGRARLERLRDVEWAITEGMGPLDSLLGTHPRWAVIAGR
jgi:2-polyprenyl-3-methyl-5-hydroxy-6-metoxy-1,4-benzoquinol methylase